MTIKYGSRDLDEILLLHTRQAMTLTNRVGYQYNYIVCRKLVANFLTSLAWKFNCTFLVNNLSHQVRYIQFKIRKTLNVHQLKWHVLENTMWDHQVLRLSEILGPNHKLWDNNISKIT